VLCCAPCEQSLVAGCTQTYN